MRCLLDMSSRARASHDSRSGCCLQPLLASAIEGHKLIDLHGLPFCTLHALAPCLTWHAGRAGHLQGHRCVGKRAKQQGEEAEGGPGPGQHCCGAAQDTERPGLCQEGARSCPHHQRRLRVSPRATLSAVQHRAESWSPICLASTSGQRMPSVNPSPCLEQRAACCLLASLLSIRHAACPAPHAQH